MSKADDPTLRRDIPLGTAFSGSQMDTLGASYVDTFLRHFRALTPENEMKMEVLRPQRARWRFAPADRLVGFARAHDKAVRGHTLVWHSQLPHWVMREPWSRDALRGYLRDYVHTVVGHFRGRVREWDVVNEPLDDHGRLRRSLWLEVIGPGYVADALRWAREADPAARLLINEHGVEWPNEKTQGLVALVRRLLAADVPLDGIGFQMHVTTAAFPSERQLAAGLRRFATLGLEVQITEMDVSTTETAGGVAGRLRAQADVYAQAARACAAEPRCARFGIWGVCDAASWIGAERRPLLFDTAYRAKPAWDAVSAVIGSGGSQSAAAEPSGPG
jgi:endo-1,4-beta-xylanase